MAMLKFLWVSSIGCAHMYYRNFVHRPLSLRLNRSASLRHASAISTRLCLAASFPNSTGCIGRLTHCGSVVLLQDRTSQQPSSYRINCESHPLCQRPLPSKTLLRFPQGLCLAASLPDSARCNGYLINCESVVLPRDRPSQQPSGYDFHRLD